MVEVLRWKPIDLFMLFPRLALLDSEDLTDIHECMPCHHEGQLRLAGGRTLYHRDPQRPGVEDRYQRREPALAVMLRAVEAENGVGDMRFENFGGPALPLLEERGQRLLSALKRMTPKQFRSARRRAGARIEQCHADLATRKRLIQHRQIADDQRDESEANARLADDERTCESAVRYDIAQAQRKQSCATDIEVGAELRPDAGCGLHHCVAKRGVHREIEQREAGD